MFKTSLLFSVFVVILSLACAKSQLPPTATPGLPPTPVPTLPPDAPVVQTTLNGQSLESITVEVGTIVEWTNTKETFHSTMHTPTRYGDLEKWSTGLLSKGQSYGVLFDEVGTFRYACENHPIKEYAIITVVPKSP